MITVNCLFYDGQCEIYYGQYWPYGQGILGPGFGCGGKTSENGGMGFFLEAEFSDS